MTDKKYNGWTNYETWLMNLILTNEQTLHNVLNRFAKQEPDDYKLSQKLKNWVEKLFYIEKYNIIRVDCETWTYRDFQEINWFEIAQSLRDK